ncbi:lipid II:glycine glycyltransferase FemX [Salinilacihabitans rarus]|uniref:lipid II:glycine glycyltransferase FemX n=1 Tax=Salinilacihabitans rarus TaxID=2961596 RepID=UPI0020C89B56|nr:GNAT family N-acetyltransferase [Salinilacihabitans rarus]
MAREPARLPRSDGPDATTDPRETSRTLATTESGHEVAVLETIQAIERERWNAVVDASPRGTVFHRYEWLDAIETALGYAPNHLVVRKDGNPIGVFPNFVVDLPTVPVRRLTSIYPGFGGPLATTDVAETLSLLTDAVPDLCTGRTVVHEIRASNADYLRYGDHLRSRGYRPARLGCRFVIDLTRGYEAIRDGMSRTRRKGIRRGTENEYEIVEEAVTPENLARFHRVYERHMERVGGETYPLSFFEALLGMESRLLLLTIRIEGEYAGGFLELLDEEQSSVHGFFAAVPEEYYEYHASELLYDHVIRWGIDRGYETYDFGGSEADFESGVFRFKESFGGRLVPNVYWERDCSRVWNLLDAGRSLYWRHSK